MSSYLANYAHGLVRHGHHQAGLKMMGEALALSESNGEIWGIPEQLRMKRDFIRATGGLDAHAMAADRYTRSIGLAQEQGALSWELRAATSLVACVGTESAEMKTWRRRLPHIAASAKGSPRPTCVGRTHSSLTPSELDA